ncbi:CCAAT/enhancer-binding protein zeta [Trichoplax sp. H2]|nr:CCAAT/enhancer-binding protein zeta [Trichoplax sp. H2]|eukprot:RDD47481.1 CCAAT/enhancer-binding protein zeta [Trichoplax sp. H2]
MASAKNDLQMEDIIALSGDEDDFKLIQSVDGDVIGDIDTDSAFKDVGKDIDQKEIKSLIKDIGLAKFQLGATVSTSIQAHDLNYAESKDKKKSKKKQKKISNDSIQNNTGTVNRDQSVSNIGNAKDQQILQNTSTLARNNQTLPDNNDQSKIFQKVLPCSFHTTIRKYLLLELDGLWYKDLEECQETIPKSDIRKSTSDVLKTYENVASELISNESELYHHKKSKDRKSDFDWLKTVMASGTLTDKTAAHAVLLQESPVHNLQSLKSLIGMSKKKGKRESLLALDTLKEVLLSNLLPDDRKLKKLSQQPLHVLNELHDSNKDVELRDKLLIYWHFEQQLKDLYAELISIIKNMLNDSILHIKNKVLGILFDLFCGKPELENVTLPMIVNKLGDPEKKVASKTTFILQRILTRHPNMKLIVITEIEQLLFRPNITERAQYYAICVLNQILLTRKESSIAAKLIKIYISLFKAAVKRKGSDTRITSSILIGTNRAYPFAKDNDIKSIEEQVDNLFRMVHADNFTISVQVLMLLYQMIDIRQSMTDRFYQSLYFKLQDSKLRKSSKQALFLNLVYKALKSDSVLSRVKAFVKRLLQVCTHEQPPFVCGTLYMLSEIFKLKPGLKTLLLRAEGSDEEEHFDDADDSDTELDKNAILDVNIKGPSEVTSDTSGYLHRSKKATNYDVKQRNPLYCGAEYSSMWELRKLKNHYHATVVHFADTLLKGYTIDYTGDPLSDFTLMRFLDRFAYKNPKKQISDHGGSVMQRRLHSQRLREEPVNSKIFLNKSIEEIEPDEVFFYRYFKKCEEEEANVIRLAAKKKRQKDMQDFDMDEIDSAEENEKSGELDFASDLSNAKKTKKRKKATDDSDEEDDEDYDYDDMNESDENDANNLSEEKLTKLLLDEMTPDEDEDNDDGSNEGSFSHLLEEPSKENSSKQLEWESKQNNINKSKQRRKKFKKQRPVENYGSRNKSKSPSSKNRNQHRIK